jgi:hypothetical protein
MNAKDLLIIANTLRAMQDLAHHIDSDTFFTVNKVLKQHNVTRVDLTVAEVMVNLEIGKHEALA